MSSIVRTIRDPFDLEDLAGGWDELAAGSGMPTQYHAWAQSCAEAFLRPGDRLSVLVAQGVDSTAIAPLVHRRGWPGRLELLGMGEVYEPMDFLYTSPSSLEALAEALVELEAPLLLGRIPAGSPSIKVLQRAYGKRGLLLSRPVHGCPWIALDAGWWEPESHLNAGRRSDLRRARRIAEGLGPLTFEVLSPTPAELPALLEEAFQVEGAGWKGRGGSSLSKDRLRGSFFRRYAARTCRQGSLRMCFLRIAGRSVAVQIAVECGGAFCLFKIGYDEAFARCSPGVLLLVETIRRAAALGLRAYEFLGTPEPWTRTWRSQVHPCVTLRGYPARGSGIVALSSDAVHATARKLGRVACRSRRSRAPS